MNGFPVTSFSAFLTDILEALVQSLEKRSLLYGIKMKQPMLGTIFLLNNYHYMLKTLAKETALGDVFAVGDRFEKLVSKQRVTYLNGYFFNVNRIVGNRFMTISWIPL
jgi:hypothetical protein